MKPIHPIALFRFSVLGELVSRHRLERGELNRIIKALASKTYLVPGSHRVTHLSEATIARWYYAWQKEGIDALAPKARSDRGRSKLSDELQHAILQLKKEKPHRSINSIRYLLERSTQVPRDTVSRSSIYRLLKSQQLSSKQCPDNPRQIERRHFVAEHAGEIWQADVMHGPTRWLNGKNHKIYLVSMLDDASRLIVHAEFRLGETALDIEAVLKQAVLKRGLPIRLMIDNGPAYRSASLQGICARLQIRLVYCPAYEPEGKGKIERWHATFRNLFLNEVDWKNIRTLDDINSRLWAWLEQDYHQRPHEGLHKKTPLECWRADLAKIRGLGQFALVLDEIFYHREKRKVSKTGCIRWHGALWEVPFPLVGKTVDLIFDPHTERACAIEFNEQRFAIVLLDEKHNTHRKRHRPKAQKNSQPTSSKVNRVELAYEDYQKQMAIPTKKNK